MILVILMIICILIIIAISIYLIITLKKSVHNPDPNVAPSFTFPNDFKSKIINNTWDTNKTLSTKYVFLSFNNDSGSINNRTISNITNYIGTDIFTGIGKIYSITDTLPSDIFQAVTLCANDNITLTKKDNGWILSSDNLINKYFIGLPVNVNRSDVITWDSKSQTFNDAKVGEKLTNDYAICYYNTPTSNLCLNHGIIINTYRIVLFNPQYDNKIKINDLVIFKSYYGVDGYNYLIDYSNLRKTTDRETFTYKTYFMFDDIVNSDLYDPDIFNTGKYWVKYDIDMNNKVDVDHVISTNYKVDERGMYLQFPGVPWYYDLDHFYYDYSWYIGSNHWNLTTSLNVDNNKITGLSTYFQISYAKLFNCNPFTSIMKVDGNKVTIDKAKYTISVCNVKNLKSYSIIDNFYTFEFWNSDFEINGEYLVNK